VPGHLGLAAVAVAGLDREYCRMAVDLECEVVTALNNFANFLQVRLGIEHDFDPPLVFEQKKAHLTAVSDRPTHQGLAASSAVAQVEDPGTAGWSIAL
jgi:hypothetical protein